MLEANYLNDTTITFEQLMGATEQTQYAINESIKIYMASEA